MITVGKATSAEYYTTGASTAGGVESYYLDAVTDGEPAGRWLGRMAADLGLTSDANEDGATGDAATSHVNGEVDAQVMQRVFGRFEHPGTGEPLGSRPQKWRSVDERLAATLADEPDALPERVAQLRAHIEGRQRTTLLGWDATFNVPKSVTVAHTALYRAEIAAIRSGNTDRATELGTVRRGIEAAILDANDAGVAVLQDLATSRVGGGSGTPHQWIAADRVTVASFFQHTNRSIDPHLHVHNVVLNRAVCADGKIRALDGEDLLAQKYAFSAVSDRALFESLARIGLESIPRADGLGRELGCIPADVVEYFSTRRQQINKTVKPLIEAAEERKGRELTDVEIHRLKQEANHATRAAKDHTAWTMEELLDRWETGLVGDAGRTLNGLADAVMADVAYGPVTAEDWSPAALIPEAVAACADRSATWGRANLISELELRLPTLGITTDQVAPLLDHLADSALASGYVVQVSGIDTDADAAADTDTDSSTTGTGAVDGDDAVDADVDADDGGGAAAAGVVLADRAPSRRRYAATGTLAAEVALRDAAMARSGHAADAAQVTGWLDAHCPTMGADQRAAVIGLATTDAAVSVLVGPAGTGKSYTAGALAGSWTEVTGGRVIGLAVSQIATTVLRDDGIAATANVAAFLAAHDRLERLPGRPQDRADHPGPDGDAVWRLGPRDVVLIDEASMVATRDLDAIRRRVAAAGARMVLTGDPRQLAAVEAGGAMDVLAGHADTYTLSEVHRFDAAWERAASLALRDGDPGALATYDRNGRLVEHASLDDALHAAARAAVADRVDGRTTIVVTGSNADAARISTAVRDTLVGLGHVEEAGLLLGRDGCTAGVGDVIACRRNDYTLGVTNREQYTVTAVTDTGGLVVAGLDDGTIVELPAEYVAADVQLGYACSVHAAQGLTVDTAHLATDGGLDPAGVYVALTRGRTRNTAHVAVTADTSDLPDLPEATTDRGGATVLAVDTTRASARSVLAAAYDRALGSASALVTAETDQAHRRTAAAILGQIENHTRGACRARMDNHLDDLVADGVLGVDTRARLATDQASEHLSRLLRAVEQAGGDPRQTLTDALTASTKTPSSRKTARGRGPKATETSQDGTDAASTADGDSADTGVADAVRQSFAKTHSIAQILSHRILRDGPPRPDLDAAGLPAELHPQDAARLADLHSALDARARDLGAQLAADPPRWALLTLGPVPDTNTNVTTDVTTDATTDAATDAIEQQVANTARAAAREQARADRADWERRAGLAAAHREAVDWDHPEQALPGMPGFSATERRASYAAAWEALGRHAERLDEADMSEGRLRARVTAWDREQQWAPAHADAALKDSALTAERARQDGILAAAEGRDEDAARLRDDAERHTRVAAAYTRIADARAEWAARTFVTRANAENAREELARRGIAPGTETDRATATAYLDHHDVDNPDANAVRATSTADVAEAAGVDAEQLAEEDAHRVITDHDVCDLSPVDDAHAAELDERSPTLDVNQHVDQGAPHRRRETATADHEASQSTADQPANGHGAARATESAPPRPQRPRRGAGPAHDVAPLGAQAAAIEAMTAAAVAAARIAADQASQDAAHKPTADADYDDAVAAAGRRRRETLDDTRGDEYVDEYGDDFAGLDEGASVWERAYGGYDAGASADTDASGL
jgi:hypothetical protein